MEILKLPTKFLAFRKALDSVLTPEAVSVLQDAFIFFSFAITLDFWDLIPLVRE